jgi:hypothetical protein
MLSYRAFGEHLQRQRTCGHSSRSNRSILVMVRVKLLSSSGLDVGWISGRVATGRGEQWPLAREGVARSKQRSIPIQEMREPTIALVFGNDSHT